MKTVPRPHLAPPTLLAALLAFALPLADPTLSSAAPAQTADGAAHDGAAVGAESPDDGKHDPPAGDGQEMRHNTLTEKERAEGWRLLFDGRSLQGWRRYDGGEMTAGWLVEDGALAHSGGGFDIIYDEVFDDFELVLDWKVEPAGNSGIFYRAALGERRIYHSAPEMQILDDAGHADGQNSLTSAGSNYGLHAPASDAVRPAGEWNTARIVVDGSSVEHWLNGEHLLSYELGSEEWLELVANSKFTEWPAYGLAKSGYVGLQDHGDRVWFRNLKIREKN